MKKVTARHRRAVDLVLKENRTKASVGREFGVTARTIRRWIDTIYPPPASQEMMTMDGTPLVICHEYGSPFPQPYRDLSTNQRRKLREQYVERFCGRCLYCGEPLEDKPHEFVCETADDIEWDNFPGGREAFLGNTIHLQHDHQTGLTLAPVHALCNAHSWYFHEAPARLQRFVEKVEKMSAGERSDLAGRLRARFE